MNKAVLALFALLLTVTTVACGGGSPPPKRTPVSPSEAKTTSVCIPPESDNSLRWQGGTCIEQSTQLYTLTVSIEGEMSSHTEINAQGTNFRANSYGSGSFRFWQEGKGILPVKVITLDPPIDGISPGMLIILKTTDLKILGLPTGAITEFKCNLDSEFVSPVVNGQVATMDRLARELDDCRMASPEYQMPL